MPHQRTNLGTRLRRIRAASWWFVACVLLACQFGCSRSVTVNEWQKEFERFAVNETNSDLSFLRESNHTSPQRTFTVIGTEQPEKSTDVVGVLLGRQTVADRDWVIFLIGRVKNRTVQDIRLAMVSDDSTQRRWEIGDADQPALKSYLEQKDRTWRARNPAREKPPLFAHDFPVEDDVFDLQVADGMVSAVHKASGARWMLALDRQSQAAHESSTVASK